MIQLDHLIVPSKDRVASRASWRTDAEFDAIFARIRAAGLAYRSNPHGPADYQVNTAHGGRIVYWDEPDGHYREMLTESTRAGP